MYKTAIFGLSLACFWSAGLTGMALAGPDSTAQPMPFEFGPDWRFVPPGELFPPPGRGGDKGGPQSLAPSRRPGRRPEAQGSGTTPDDAALQRAEALKKAMAPRPDPTELRREKLDKLFARLTIEQDPAAAKRLADMIETSWLQSGSETADLLMQRAQASMSADQYRLALDLLDKIITLEPDWVEAWNQRAAARWHSGDIDGAMTDIDHVLKREPRHFGAMVAMGTILERAGFEERALEVFRRALAVFPLLPELRDHIDRLAIDVEGRGI